MIDFESTAEIPVFGAVEEEDVITLEAYQNLVLRRAPIGELNYTKIHDAEISDDNDSTDCTDY